MRSRELKLQRVNELNQTVLPENKYNKYSTALQGYEKNNIAFGDLSKKEQDYINRLAVLERKEKS